MKRKLLVFLVPVLLFGSFLPLARGVSAALNAPAPGFIADLGSDSGQSGLPLVGSDSQRWDLLKIDAPEAWPIVSGGQGAVVAVLDTGIDSSDKSLAGKVIGRTSFLTGDQDKLNGHGTFIAGIIAGAAGDTGIAGLAYNSRLLDVQVAGEDGTTDALKVAEGIIWAVDHGAEVINISIVINQPYPLLEYAVNYAWQKGCLIVAAAGNTASTDPVYPASYSDVIAVAATGKTDSLAAWSNRGSWVSVAAPGVDIYSTLPDDKTGYESGTSFSTALVSGEAALLYPRVVDTNGDGRVNDEVRDLILNDGDAVKNMNSGNTGDPLQRINVFNAATTADLLRNLLTGN